MNLIRCLIEALNPCVHQYRIVSTMFDNPADPKVTTPAKPLTTRAPSPDTTNASTAPPGTSPAQTSQETAAIALVRAYVDEYNNALQSGSTTAFRDTFNKRCALCFGDARRIDEYTRSSRTINGGAFTLIAPKAIRMSSGQILCRLNSVKPPPGLWTRTDTPLTSSRSCRASVSPGQPNPYPRAR